MTSAEGGLLQRTLRRRWVPILTQGILLVVALESAAYVLVHPSYRASSLIRVELTPINLYPQVQDISPTSMKTEVQMLTSPNVLSAAANNPKVAALTRIQESGDPIIELRKLVEVNVLPETSLIEVSTTSASAIESATIVNAVVDAYMASHIEWASGTTRNQINSLEKYLADLNSQMNDLDKKWIELAGREKLDRGSTTVAKVEAEEDRQFRAKMVENDLKRIEIQARLEVLRARDPGSLTAIVALETDLEAANVIDKALKARLSRGAAEADMTAATEVKIVRVKEKRAALIAMSESVLRQLEQLKFTANGEEQVRPINTAMPPGRPISDYRQLALTLIPIATFALVVGFFAWVEGRSTSRAARSEVV